MVKRVETGWLLDFYGPLLTGRQQETLRLYCEEDLSLAEIAEQEGVSRQAVHDAVRRGGARLRMYEDQLGLLRRYRRLYEALRRCGEVLALQDGTGGDGSLCAAPEINVLRDSFARLAREEGLDGF